MQAENINIKCYQNNKMNQSNSMLRAGLKLESYPVQIHCISQKLSEINRFAPGPQRAEHPYINQPIAYHGAKTTRGL